MDDVVECLLLAQKASPSAVMNLGGGNRVSLAEAIATLGEVMGVQPRLDVRPVEGGDVRDTWGNVNRAVQLIGYRHTIKLAAGLEEECARLGGETSMGK